MTAAIVVEGLTCRFGDVVAVDDLSLEIGAGEVFGLLGHNGAGKTTTVRALNGVVAPAAGRMRVLGLSPQADGPALRRRTAVLTESASVDERLTGRETLRIFAALFGVPAADVEPRVAHLLDDAGLAERADDRVGGYSKGMRQRLALARALVHEPEVLFLDEPSGGLDPAATRRLHARVRAWSRDRGRTLVLCTHNLAEAQALCDRVAVLARGRLLAAGSPAELARRLGARAAVRVVVEPAQQDEARRVAGALSEVEVEADGDDALVVRGGGASAPALAAALVGAGVRLHALLPAEPSLEDVYFALQPELAEAAP
jgi:ABC-2 type transport system ATP-binding protein